MRNFKMRFWIVLILVILAIYFMIFNFTDIDRMDHQQIFYYITLATIIGMAIIPRFIEEPNKSFMQLSYWILITLLLITGYTYRDDIMSSRVALELFPQYGIKNQNGMIQYKMNTDGHFKIRAKINGQIILFMLDTGASDVNLTKEDAKRIGINIDKLNFSKVYNTANGQVRGAPIVINRISLSKDFYIDNIESSVNGGDINISLLGMSFLEKIHGYKVEKGVLTLIR